MTKKQLKNLALKIVDCEKIIQANENEELVEKAKDDIINLSRKVVKLEDMIAIDDLIMRILEKK